MADVQMDIYEDMFKEITKKIYGQDVSSEDRQFGEQDAFKMVEEGLSMIDNETTESFGDVQLEEDPWVTNDETISWTTSKIASYNAEKKLFKCQECESVGLLSSVAEHWLGTHADVKVFQCPQCPYASAWARCIRIHLTRQHNVAADQGTEVGTPWKESPVLEEVTSYLARLKSKSDVTEPEEFVGSAPAAVEDEQLIVPDPETHPAQKRFNCTHCPYATDRRDLYTRHENIHKEDKPFQCDICQKQFNRADHVKKHYTRMHREHEYCLSRVKRDPFGKTAANVQASQRVTLYSGDPPPESDAQPQQQPQQIILSQTIDATHPSIITAPLTLDDQQQTVVNIAVVNFNEQTGTHTIQIPIPTSQIKPVMFAPDTLMTVDSIINPNGSTGNVLATTSAVTSKPKGKGSRKNFEKRYSCTFCSWSGVDNWCLKRHLNTHMKPYECMFCEYKAARAERLATHVFKVHSKRMCCRCSYVAQDQDDLYAHQTEHNHKSVRSRRTQTSPTPSSPDQVEHETDDKNNDVIVVWPMPPVDSQNSISI
ncbi:zinc finger protein 429 isoform X2 [Daktulosphaira vitifoliae]|nr:zinc finger protein 429 isoform X2 [Daktulosphaira vitifoliae]XP_050541661.1 zinc finger protein 429 isoform X2 [Daktulosphaira vitifoliae]